MSNECQDFGLEVINGGERTTLQQLTRQDTEPHLNLIEPGTVGRCVMEDDPMSRIAEKGGTGLAIMQDARLAFHTQVDVQIRFLSHPAHQSFGSMGVKVVDDEVPTLNHQVCGNHSLNVGQKVGFLSSWTTERSDDVTASHIAAQDENTGAVTDVFKLNALNLARRQGQTRVLVLQGLNTRHFIGADDALTLLCQAERIAVQLANVFDLGVKVGIMRRG